MKKNELRIGDLVLTENSISNLMDITEVESIQHDGINITDGIGNTYETEFYFDLIQPIPLTKEWLLRLGFKLMPESEYTVNTYINNGVKLWNKERDFTDLVFEHTSISVKYVHQLQNLYFALTEEELEVKETATN